MPYKVVRNYDGRLVSSFALGEMQVTYLPGEFVTPPPAALALGYGLWFHPSVFDAEDQVAAETEPEMLYTYEIWKCEIGTWLPYKDVLGGPVVNVSDLEYAHSVYKNLHMTDRLKLVRKEQF